MDFRIRPATRGEMAIPIDWAAQEGWNPGLHDADSFHATDPEGFLIGFLGDEPVASISSVAYDDSFGFLGFYIVKPEHRGRGYGMRLWEEAMQRLPTHTIGLDGVVAQQENYRKSGFTLAYRNIRYEGTGTSVHAKNPSIISLSDIPFDQVRSYDDDIFPVSRPVFLERWISQPGSYAIGFLEDGILRGYGIIRPCRNGWKVGPLFADNAEIADIIFQELRGFAAQGNPIFLDVPEVNAEAVALAQRYDMKPMFETARMYRGKAPDAPLEKVFGVTTFELG